MITCSYCGGEGYETYEENGRMVRDACYHCGTSGKVDAETAFHDSLMSVALSMAEHDEREYRKWRNQDPDGEGYDFCAAENMMDTFEYFKMRVYEKQYEYFQEIEALPLDMQKVLVAWNEYCG